jgi:signal transduction histidine kinase
MVQDTAGALMLLEGYRQSQSRAEASQGKPSEAIDKAIDALRRAVDEGRRVIRGVRPIVLDDLGVIAAIKDLVHQSADSGVEVQFDCDEAMGRLPKNLETAIYRVTQEALTNTKKHSGSNSARIELRKDSEKILLQIRDSGQGFDTKGSRHGAFGLLGMTERVRLLGGTCSIRSQPGVGTQIVARFPIPQLSS